MLLSQSIAVVGDDPDDERGGSGVKHHAFRKVELDGLSLRGTETWANTGLYDICPYFAGVMAAYLWCFPRSKLFQVILFIQLKLPVWVYLLGWVGLQLIMGLELFGEQLGVAWFAHLFGFIAGAAMTPLILGQRRKEVAAQVKVPARQLGMI